MTSRRFLLADRSASLKAVAALALLVSSSCADDLPAPTDYAAGNSGGGASFGVDCSTIPRTAVGATYAYAPTITGSAGPVLVEVGELPEGLTFDTATKTITGTATTAGEYTFFITVTDVAGNTVQDECALTVAPQLTSNFDTSELPACARPGDSLLDFVAPETGDGTPITCAFDGDKGDGRIPTGMSIDPEACTVTGTPPDDLYGTALFVMRGSQSGVDLHVPFCVTRDELPADSYTIYADHSGLVDAGTIGTQAALIPISATFDPEQPLAVGEDGDIEFRVVSADDCGGGSCFYGYAYFIYNSPFDPATFSLEPDKLLMNAENVPVGFTHTLSWSGDPPGADFAQRPFVAPVSLRYCIAADNQTCNGAQNAADNGKASLAFGIIMWPQ